MNEQVFQSAEQLSAQLCQKAFSAVELFEAHAATIEAHEPQVNAFVHLDLEAGRKRAQEADAALKRGEVWGPLHGLPISIKDTNEVAGMPCAYGATRRPQVTQRDGTLVARLRQAGAIILGKTNTPLAGYEWQCKNPRFGRTNNPWNFDHTVGGSSGGSTAAVSAGFAALELGSDVAGSIRVPCHFSGVAGIRPTEGRLSNFGSDSAPGLPRGLLNLLSSGPIARRVSDLQWCFPLLEGADPMDWRIPPPPPSVPINNRGLRGLRIAYSDSLGGVPICTETQKAQQALLEKLEDAGCQIEAKNPEGFSFEEAIDTWGRIQGFEFAALFPFPLRSAAVRWLYRFGLPQMLFGWNHFSNSLGKGLALSSRGYLQALTKRHAQVRCMDDFLSQWDLWITPVAATPAFTHRRMGKALSIDDTRHSYADCMAMYTCPTALTAHPIVVFPVALTATGLPVGMQFHGRRWHDHQLLSLATQIETILRPLPIPYGLSETSLNAT